MDKLVVMGASAGGIEAFRELLPILTPNDPASYFLVQHRMDEPVDRLVSILAKTSALPVVAPEHGTAIKRGQVYVAPPGRHLVVQKGHVQLSSGPRENRSRPSIDVLFRSAAAAYGPNVIGVLLSGMLDDGVAGLNAIRRSGGATVVQEPAEALYPDLPNNGLRFASPSHVARLRDLGHLLNQLIHAPVDESIEPPEDVVQEVAVQTRIRNGGYKEEGIHEAPGGIAFETCPDCGGTLRCTDDDGYLHFRCHTGHAYGQETLLHAINETTERAIYTAIRALEERHRLLSNLAYRDEEAGRFLGAKAFHGRASEMDEQLDTLRQLVRHDLKSIGRPIPEN